MANILNKSCVASQLRCQTKNLLKLRLEHNGSVNENNIEDLHEKKMYLKELGKLNSL